MRRFASGFSSGAHISSRTAKAREENSDEVNEMLISLIRAVVLYIVLILVVRLMG